MKAVKMRKGQGPCGSLLRRGEGVLTYRRIRPNIADSAKSPAATAMAAGDISQRVAVTTNDEVGRLAVAFNLMADELAEVDRQVAEAMAPNAPLTRDR